MENVRKYLRSCIGSIKITLQDLLCSNVKAALIETLNFHIHFFFYHKNSYTKILTKLIFE